MGPFRRYFVTMFLVLLALGIVSALFQGQGLGGIAGAFLSMAWVGWIVPLVCLPLFIALLWALPRAFERFPSEPRSVVGIATGLAVWALVALVVFGLLSVGSEVGPGAPPPTLLALVGGSLVVGAFGALLGLIETRAW